MLLPASCTASCGYKSFSALDGLLINKSEAQLSSENKNSILKHVSFSTPR